MIIDNRIENRNRVSITLKIAIFSAIILLSTAFAVIFMPKGVTEPAFAEGLPTPEIIVSDLVVDYDGSTHSIGEVNRVIVKVGAMELNYGDDYLISYKSDAYTEDTQAPTNAGSYTVKVFVYNTDEYSYNEKIVNLTISKVKPIEYLTGSFEQQYGIFVPATYRVVGLKNEFEAYPEMVYSFGDPSVVTPDAGAYYVTSVFEGSENYYPTSISRAIRILPRDVVVTFSGDDTFEYDGFSHVRTVTRTGVVSKDAETFALILKYNDENEAKNVGTYDISVALNDDNYKILRIEGEQKLTITKKELIVTANDVKIPYGQEPEFTFTYEGFTFSDNEKNAIGKQPEIQNVATEIGEYEIVPVNAEAQNYYFVYKPGRLLIYAIHFEGNAGGVSPSDISVDGVFSPDSELYLMSYKYNDGYMEAFTDVIKQNRQIIAPRDVLYAFSVEFKEGGMQNDTCTITITDIKFRPLYQTKLAVVDMKGNCHLIEKYTYNKSEGTITFQTHFVGTVIIYSNTRLTYILAGVLSVILALIIILLITAEVLYHRRKNEHRMSVTENNDPTEYQKTHKKYQW